MAYCLWVDSGLRLHADWMVKLVQQTAKSLDVSPHHINDILDILYSKLDLFMYFLGLMV